MKENDRLRGLEIQFYLVCYDLARFTKPMTIQNIFTFFEFLEKIDFTKELNYDILKTLAQTIFTEQTNIQPNRVELCNFCYTHNIKLPVIRKYTQLPKHTYDATLRRIKEEVYYQPTHLQPEIYQEIEKFLSFVKKLSEIGVKVNAKVYK